MKRRVMGIYCPVKVPVTNVTSASDMDRTLHLNELHRYDAHVTSKGASPCAFWTGEACDGSCPVQSRWNDEFDLTFRFFGHKGCYPSLELSRTVFGLVDTRSNNANKELVIFLRLQHNKGPLYAATMIRVTGMTTLNTQSLL